MRTRTFLIGLGVGTVASVTVSMVTLTRPRASETPIASKAPIAGEARQPTWPMRPMRKPQRQLAVTPREIFTGQPPLNAELRAMQTVLLAEVNAFAESAKLTDGQREALARDLAEAADTYRERILDRRDLTDAATMVAFQEVDVDVEARLSYLTDEQWREFRRQFHPASAFIGQIAMIEQAK